MAGGVKPQGDASRSLFFFPLEGAGVASEGGVLAAGVAAAGVFFLGILPRDDVPVAFVGFGVAACVTGCELVLVVVVGAGSTDPARRGTTGHSAL